ncbi:MAG: DUF3021 domain-containing protein [Lachnospiraceae bacterium]|nr:DUF3021 domain-containing protein [Lachnospiraceae bacterium]
MTMKDCFRRIYRSFFVITTFTLLMTALFTYIFCPGDRFSNSLLWEVLIFSVLVSMLGFLFYSKKELSKHQMFIRQLIHMMLLTPLVFGMALLFGWIEIGALSEGITLLLMIVFVYIMVWTICYRADENEAKKINERLKNFQSR